ncbi:uncharacterized protein LOC117653549 [Thrips palmi]|uniref:Uncharacterized protein LOC117653549 n=1 Tax=Thrips palmi TaxID=161013 RepID=A0A6P9AD19_THRPL|nr:uncharacterized protein LOC117653549 [Thrips palmi]
MELLEPDHPDPDTDHIYCCDPFKRHKRLITKCVRLITSVDPTAHPELSVGLYICDNCRKGFPDIGTTSVQWPQPEGGPICSDPFQKHLKPIFKNLRIITATDGSDNPSLTVGSYLCDNCRKCLPSLGTCTIKNANKLANEPDQIFCSNPHQKHKLPVSKNLRVISAFDVLLNPNLTAGSHWCDNCRKDTQQHAHGKDLSSIQVSQPSLPSDTNQSCDKNKCCNPFNIVHAVKVTGSNTDLREIKENDKKNCPALTVGMLWCSTCRKMSSDQKPGGSVDGLENDEVVGLADIFADIADELSGKKSESNSQNVVVVAVSQASATSCSPRLSPAVHQESALRTCTGIGISPLDVTNIRTTGGKIAAVKRKLGQATSLVAKKLCSAVGITTEELSETSEGRKLKDYDDLLNEVKERLTTASRSLKYKLLSLVPSSMSINGVASTFEVSRNVARRARELKAEKGILPEVDFSRKSGILESTKLLVQEFYCSDDNSKVLPGTRDCVSVKKGVYEQKRLILCNIAELYKSFKEKHGNLKIGLSMFYLLRPKWCIFAGGAGTHEQCICQTHQNFKLLLYALNIKMDYRDLIKMCVCDSEDRSCMLKLCDKCPTSEEVQKILREQLTVPEELNSVSADEEYEFLEENIKFRQWKSTDRTEMIIQVSKRSELIELAARKMNTFIPHCFIAKSQKEYIKKLKEELPMTKATVAMDFAMNYNCLIQGAVQSYHWSPKQATVHPTLISYKDANNVLVQKSLIFISDDLDHDVPLVRKFQERIATYIKENLPQIEEVEYITDGCGSQYKCKGYFNLLLDHKERLGLRATHTHHGSGHGKTRCDADGGTVKRTARTASLQRPFENQIVTAKDLFDFCQQEMKDTFDFQFVSKEEVEPYRQQYKGIVDGLETVPGTRSFHFFKPLGNRLACFRISNDKTTFPSLVHSLQKTARQEIEPLALSNGIYVVARIGKNRYIGLVTDLYSEEGEADLSLLMPRLPSKQFKWPRDMKTVTVPLPHILCQVELLEKEEVVTLTTTDLEKLYDQRILKRPQN